MSTLTPTSDLAPAGAPDLRALAAMANSLFQALPGREPELTSASAPQAATPVLTGQPTPGRASAVAPHSAAPNGLPDTLATSAPVQSQLGGGQALGVPQGHSAAPQHGHAAALPQATAPSALSSAPFYFLGGFGYPESDGTAAVDDRVSAQAFGLPGAEALKALLQSDRHDSGAAGYYYFLEPPRSAEPALPTATGSGLTALDVHAVRRDFPILQERVGGKQLVWFDNAATTQKPQAVIDRLAHFYAHENSNIHRAAHELAARATDAYEGARETVRRFIGAASTEEIIFVRGTTEAINLIAKSWGAQNVGAGDEIIVSHLEHHANIVPWQQLAAEKGAKIRVIPVDDDGQVILSEYRKLLSSRTKIVSVTQVSNALGTVVPVHEIVALAHAAGAKTVVDGAQSVSHMRVDVRALDTDFFVFSGHKIFGPTGIGAVYGKREVLEHMPPWQGGGNMIADVTFEKTVYHGPPTRFEAGTGNIADAVGLGAALEYVERIGIDAIGAYEHALLDYATHHLKPIPGVRLVGTAAHKASVLSFVLAGYSTDEVGQALNAEGIAVRTGHHCAQPILRRFGLEATVRPSLAFYNTCEEVDRFIAVVRRLAGQRR
jgi:cysteine desulfurase/selenocysteine lyase